MITGKDLAMVVTLHKQIAELKKEVDLSYARGYVVGYEEALRECREAGVDGRKIDE